MTSDRPAAPQSTESPAAQMDSLWAAITRGAAVTMTVALIAACSHAAAPQRPAAPVMPPPGPHATQAELAAWIQSGTPVRPADFHTVTSRGTTTTLPDPADVAFRPPGTDNGDGMLSGCVTGFSYGRELDCLPPLRERPPKPGAPGEWISGWVTFDGAKITVGSFHGDPGPFNDGVGKPLNYGDTITFGDYQCRSDPSGIYCMSRSHQSGLGMSTAITPYGCVKLPIHSKWVGEQYLCGGTDHS